MVNRRAAVIPSNDKEFNTLMNRITSNIPSGYCGITEADLDPYKSAADEFKIAIMKADEAQASSRQAVKEKQACRLVLDKLARPLIRQIKNHPDYTEAFGYKLGIEGRLIASQDLSNISPSLKAVNKTGGTVEIRFVRRNSDGINLYYQREQDTAWTLVGRAMSSPFMDIRPLVNPGQSEIRRYTAVYMRQDKEVSNYSDDISITCTP